MLTVSASAMPRWPAPAPVRYVVTGAPNPPAPITRTDASKSFRCPSMPNSGSIVCRELLGLRAGQQDAPMPSARTKAYYAGRPCAEIVASAAEILQQMLEEQEQGE